MKRIYLDEIESTNAYIEENIKNLPENALIIAKHQTNGRGQFQRTWFSEPEKSLALSFLFWNKQHKNTSAIQKTPYVIAETINQLYKIKSKVILPNDIYLNEKKLCGVLIETTYCPKELLYTIVGIGLNLNNASFPSKIADIATSIKIETGVSADAEELINALEKEMETLYV